MSVVIARVDERLIHGQVATAWLKSYPTQIVIAIDDASANDPLQTMLLQMAVSGRMKCEVTTLGKAKSLIEKYGKYPIFLCAKSPKVFLELLRQGVEIPHVNIGGIYAKDGRRQYYPTVFLDNELKEDILALEGFPCKVEYRTVPQNTEVDIVKELKEKN